MGEEGRKPTSLNSISKVGAITTGTHSRSPVRNTAYGGLIRLRHGKIAMTQMGSPKCGEKATQALKDIVGDKAVNEKRLTIDTVASVCGESWCSIGSIRLGYGLHQVQRWIFQRAGK